MRRLLPPFALLVGCVHGAPPVARDALISTAERSQFTRTGRYDEAVALCHAFARAYAGVACETIGASGEGRAIVALRVRRAGKHAPEIVVQAGIHAGEIEGKDAGFVFLRDLLDGKVAPGALAAVNVAFVPIVNPDGHERFGPNQRPNQRGPLEGGFRTTGARLNMNRDFVKLDAPETRAAVGLLVKDDPVLFVDLHTTDGAKFQHDVSINVAPVAARPERDPLAHAGEAVSRAIATRLRALGHLPVEFYPSFVKDDDPSSGFARGEAPPRFGHFYASARGRLGILVETHSWRTFAERATSTYHTLQAIFELATADAGTWQLAERTSDQVTAALAGRELPLVWDNTAHATPIDFLGYAYAKRHSEISNADWIVYDEAKPETWHVPLYDELAPKATATIPAAGWIVDGGVAARVGDLLAAHGIQFRRIADGAPPIAVDAFRATGGTPDGEFEGHARLKLAGAWHRETRTLERGALFVPSAQPLARLAAHVLDPAGPDSLAQWGLLATAFEQKEYMEGYVAEEVARELLAKDPKLADEFAAALAADPALAASPAKRLDWFYRRSPAWDERLDLLPIYRAPVAP